MTVFWIFKEPGSGKVRFSSTDPSLAFDALPMDQRPVETVVGPFPDGVLMSTAVGQLNALLSSMGGDQGDEAYVKVQIGS